MYEIKEIKTAIQIETTPDKKLVFKNYEEVKAISDKLLEQCRGVQIDKDNYSYVKEVYKNCAKLKKAFSDVKNEFLKDYTYDYQQKTKAITSVLNESIKELEPKLEQFEKEGGFYKQNTIYITFKTKDSETAKKIIQLVKEKFEIEGEIK